MTSPASPSSPAPAPSSDGPPPDVGAMLPALGPSLALALGELGEGEVLVAGELARVEALGLAPHRGRREVPTAAGALVVERAALGEVVAAAMLAGWQSCAVDLGRVVARAEDGGGALCVFVLAGGCWWTRVRPSAPPATPATAPSTTREPPRVALELSLPCALAWLRLLSQWGAFGPAVNGAPLVELREALERAVGGR